MPAAETTDETAVKTATKTGTTPALDATAPAAAALDADIHATTGGVAAGGIAPGSPAAVAALASPAAALQRPATNVWWRRGAIAAGITGLGLLGVYARTGTATPDPNIAHGMQVAEAVSLARLVTAGVPSAPDADAARLLEQADARLHGPNAARDKAEAAGLLRRYLASTLGDERTLWALTQLGSVYAEPPAGSQPDYANARRLWELSGALGDPVAMCFVAALHEHGLGVRTDKAVALGWYRQSKHAGGCRDVDAAIERLKGKK